MLNDLANWLFNPAGLTPHGFCLLWQPWLIWTHAISDLTVGLAYFSIPLGLGVIFRKRPDLIYRQMLGLFASFILLCGLTHWLDLVTLYVPLYGLQAVVKALTALVSILTAIALWRLLPKALRLPSLAQLQELNDDLRRSREFLNRIGEMAGVGGWELDIATGRLTWSAETYRIHGLAENYQPTLADWTSFFCAGRTPGHRGGRQPGDFGG